MSLRPALGLCCVLLAACQSAPPPLDQGRTTPAIVTLDAPARLYAVSDVHGAYERLVALLLGNGLLQARPTEPAAARWGGGAAMLLVLGDVIDKGPDGLEVIALLQALEADAPGRVMVLLGNHEAEFLADPLNDKAQGPDGFGLELTERGVDAREVARGRLAPGPWLLERPLGARVGRWFFAHAGQTDGRSVEALEARLFPRLRARDYRSAVLLGQDSILEGEGWYRDGAAVQAGLQALEVDHLVFGHDPSALGRRGEIGLGAGLLRIDCGMSPEVGDGAGKLLSIVFEGPRPRVEELDPAGRARVLFEL